MAQEERSTEGGRGAGGCEPGMHRALWLKRSGGCTVELSELVFGR